jgi:tRNA nucleotidyltransferase (CCA-adding enzyme)
MSGASGSEGHWEHFGHDADIGVHGAGGTKAEAFRQAAIAMTGVITDPACVRAEQRIDVSCSAPDDELLLLEWLNTLVYEMATRRMLFADFEIRIDQQHLVGVAIGEPVDPARHEPAVEVKGATCTSLSVREEDGMWHARCVVDV